MVEILVWIENRSPFIQGLMASAVFGATIFALKIILKLAARASVSAMNDYNDKLLMQHWLYRFYVNSHDEHLRNEGFNIVIFLSTTWFLRGMLVFMFFLCIDSILNKNWLWVVCSWIVFNLFLESSKWLKDRSDLKHIGKIDKGAITKFVSKLPEHQAKIFEMPEKDS